MEGYTEILRTIWYLYVVCVGDGGGGGDILFVMVKYPTCIGEI